MLKFEQCIKFEPCAGRADVKLPKRSTAKSAGYDFFAPHDFEIPAGESLMIWTGVKAYMMPWNVLLLMPRSSMGRYGIRFSNTIGVIDSDYVDNPNNEGEIALPFINNGRSTWSVKAGDKIAQGIFVNYLTTDDDDVKKERTGGFGSTGK
jgi:dUTP pyrophosphatase